MATWQGLGTGNWSNPFNWLGFTLPNGGTDANISSGSAIVDINSAAALNVNLSNAQSVDVSTGGVLAVTNVFNVGSLSNLIVHNGGAVAAGGGFNIAGGRMIVGGAVGPDPAGTVGGNIGLNGGTSELAFNSSTDTTFSNVVSGSGFVQKYATSKVTLTGANSYSGATAVNEGVLNIQNATALGSTAGGTSVAAGAALEIQGATFAVGTEALTLNGTGVSSGGALRNVSGTHIWNGAITLGSATRINTDAGQLELRGISGAGHTLTVGGAGLTYIFAITTGSGGLIKDGTGVLRLDGVSTYTGSTTISGGTLG